MTKTILITGATSGFGRAAVHRFANAGWRVIATGRRIERLKHSPPNGLLDTSTSPPSICGIAPHYTPRFKRYQQTLPTSTSWSTTLALALGTAPAQHADLAQWREMIDTNITSLVTLTHHVLPTLIERKGTIINISSVAATYPYIGGNVYAGTKAFMKQFSLGLRSDLHGTGARVTSIEPGMAETEFTLVRTGGNQAASDALYRGANSNHSRRYCRTNLLRRHTTTTSQHQSARDHAR